MPHESTPGRDASCLVVGAGIAGLTAARELQRKGIHVTMIEKSRGVGGRMATRRFEGGIFDHGTQYFAPSSPWFQARIAEWVDEGLAQEWFRVRSYEMDPRFISSARYCGRPAMTAIPKALAGDIGVHTGERVLRLEREGTGWTAETDSGARHTAASCILTPPVPQTLEILERSGRPGAVENYEALAGLVYEPCITVLAVCAAAPALPENGVLEFERGTLRRIMDNRRKGISPDAFAVTIHAMGDFSAAHFEDSDDEVAGVILEEALPILQVPVTARQVHRWRYSQVLAPYPEALLLLEHDPPLCVAGDAFGINGVEGAARSGMEAAQIILRSVA